MSGEAKPRIRYNLRPDEYNRLIRTNLIKLTVLFGFLLLWTFCLMGLKFLIGQLHDMNLTGKAAFTIVLLVVVLYPVLVFNEVLDYLYTGRRMKRYFSSFIPCVKCLNRIPMKGFSGGPPNEITCPRCAARLEIREGVMEAVYPIDTSGQGDGQISYEKCEEVGPVYYTVPKAVVHIGSSDPAARAPSMKVRCPSCGSSNAPLPGDKETSCAYCGRPIDLDELTETVDGALLSHAEPLKAVEELDPDRSTKPVERGIPIQSLMGGLSIGEVYVIIFEIFTGIIVLAGIAQIAGGGSEVKHFPVFIGITALFIGVPLLMAFTWHYRSRIIRQYVLDNIECPLCNRTLPVNSGESRDMREICSNCGLPMTVREGRVRVQRTRFIMFDTVIPGVIVEPHSIEMYVDFELLKRSLRRKGVDVTNTSCPNCGADVEFPRGGNIAVCKHCSTDYSPLQLGRSINSSLQTVDP